MQDQYCFDITDFGAVADGTKDSTDAIQQACEKAAAVHGTVIIPSGKYLCGYIKVPAGIVIEGTYTWNWSYHAGFAGSILQQLDADMPCMLDLTDAHGTTLNGLSLDGRRLGNCTHGVLIRHTSLPEEEDGIKIGKADGIAEGTVRTLLNLVNSGNITLDYAIANSGLDKEKFISVAHSLGYTL